MRQQLNAQRTVDFAIGSYKRAGGVPDTLPEAAPVFMQDYFDYYKTERGYHERSLNSNDGWNVTSSLSFLNMPLLSYIDEIQSAVLLLHGEEAHSLYFSQDAFEQLQGDNKELTVIPNASHVDLYDQTEVIPFDQMTEFFQEHLN